MYSLSLSPTGCPTHDCCSASERRPTEEADGPDAGQRPSTDQEGGRWWRELTRHARLLPDICGRPPRGLHRGWPAWRFFRVRHHRGSAGQPEELCVCGVWQPGVGPEVNGGERADPASLQVTQYRAQEALGPSLGARSREARPARGGWQWRRGWGEISQLETPETLTDWLAQYTYSQVHDSYVIVIIGAITCMCVLIITGCCLLLEGSCNALTLL